MRRLLILLLLAGCESEPAAETALPEDGVAAAGQVPGAPSPAQNQQRAAQALAAILADPDSARYSEVRGGAAGAVCGLVDAKEADGKFGGKRPFVVTPEGVAVISTTPKIMFEDPEDIFPDFYIRWCASPEELRGLGPSIAAQGLPELPPVEENMLLPDPVLPPPGPAEVPQAQTSKPPSPAPPPADEDSFSRAVLRNGSESR